MQNKIHDVVFDENGQPKYATVKIEHNEDGTFKHIKGLSYVSYPIRVFRKIDSSNKDVVDAK